MYILPKRSHVMYALEPYMEAQNLEIHDRLHEEETERLNQLVEIQHRGDMRYLEEVLRRISQHNKAWRHYAGSYFNHALFWSTLAPNAQLIAEGELAELIKRYFGDLSALKDLMMRQAMQWHGSGWVWLLLRYNGTLAVSVTPNNDNPLMDITWVSQGYPILGIDLWEHAYYLQYRDKKADYLKAIWSVLDWHAVAENYQKAKHKIDSWNRAAI